MRIDEITNGPVWVRYTNDSLIADFKEYKGKELSKWKLRAQQVGFIFPLFKDIEDFKQSLDQAKIVDNNLLTNVGNRTENDSIEDIESMVSGYHRPRNVQRIVDGMKSGATLPMPIILKGKNRLFIMAGNTRQAVARVLNVPCKVLLVDLIK